jgi:hypothetical protein
MQGLLFFAFVTCGYLVVFSDASHHGLLWAGAVAFAISWNALTLWGMRKETPRT